jgi:hypothetical protein
MRISSFISFVGFVIIIAATYCPIVHFTIFNQDVYQLNKPYGIVFLLVAVVGIIGTVFNNIKLTKLVAWLMLALVIFFYIAALFKIHFSFSFIPLPSLAGYLSRQIKFKWGWYLLCSGSVIAVIGAVFNKNIKKLAPDTKI